MMLTMRHGYRRFVAHGAPCAWFCSLSMCGGWIESSVLVVNLSEWSGSAQLK